jgi:hypothetical protein
MKLDFFGTLKGRGKSKKSIIIGNLRRDSLRHNTALTFKPEKFKIK